MLMYHGSKEWIIDKLISGNINTSKGGGEIGQGFYLGDMLHIAKAWAWQRHNKSKAVLEVEVDDKDLIGLKPLSLDYDDAVRKRLYIRRIKQQRTYLFKRNIVCAPIVGGRNVRGDQYKWESGYSEYILNGRKVRRSKR